MAEKTNLKTFWVVSVYALAAAFVLYWTNPVSATIYYVNPGESIQAAIDAASYGDTVEVAAGTYVENIMLKNGVALIGAGESTTTIDGNYAGTVVTVPSGCDSNTVIDGFTITNGHTTKGGGMHNYHNSNPTVVNCTFSNNDASYGGGMYNSESNPTVTNCTFKNNFASYGGGMYNYYNSPTVTNCTFSYNGGDIGAGMYNEGSNPTVTNCIFWYFNCIYDDFLSTSVVTYSNIQGSFPGEGNIDADPLFVDVSNGDYRLLPTSPCIDAGNNSAVPAGITTDLDGMSRFVDDPNTADTGSGTPPIVDMGAYEYFANDAPVADAGGPYTVNQNQNLMLDASASTPGGDDASYGDTVILYEWDLDNDGAFDDHITNDAVTTLPWDILSTFSRPVGPNPPIPLRVTDKTGLTDTAATTLTITYRPLYWQKDEEQKLVASDGAADDHFGISVSISGNYAIVGTYDDDDNGSDSGSAYIFAPNDINCNIWDQQAKLVASDGAAYDYFGISVSISGNKAVVGAHCDDESGYNSGTAYIFKRDGMNWSEQAKLVALDGASNDYFGRSVSISGDYAVVSAYYDDDNGIESGSAYIFAPNEADPNDWIQVAKLTASDGAANDLFGFSVSISGDYAIVGAVRDDSNGDKSGSAYVFKRDGTSWSEQAKLVASDGAADDRFGWSVSIIGDYAIIGAVYDDDNGDNSGSAYIFRRDGESWCEQAKLLASDGSDDDHFGRSVSISGAYAVVGTYEDDDNGNESGSVYIFKRSGASWSEEAKFVASDGAADDRFGYSVSISGDKIIAGAYGDDDNGESSGSAYVFGMVPCPAADLTGNCFVDMEDFAFFALEWLTGK